MDVNVGIIIFGLASCPLNKLEVVFFHCSKLVFGFNSKWNYVQ